MGKAGGEDQRRAFERENHLGLQEAGDLVGVVRFERREDGFLDGGQADDDDRLRLVERRRHVEPEIERLAFGEAEAGDVLILRGAKAGDELHGVYDRPDIRRVEATARGRGVGGLVDEVRRRAVGESFGDVLTVAVVEQNGSAGLR